MGHNEVEIYQILQQGITLSCPKFLMVMGLRVILLGILANIGVGAPYFGVWFVFFWNETKLGLKPMLFR